MFDSWSEISRKQHEPESFLGRWLRYLAVLVATLVAFGALYAGITLLE